MDLRVNPKAAYMVPLSWRGTLDVIAEIQGAEPIPANGPWKSAALDRLRVWEDSIQGDVALVEA
jgi:hypothetical protein